jgi:hypothetical protein
LGSNIIYNPNKIKRPVSFEGLPHIGSCSPTDIDFSIEVGDEKKYLIGDFKEWGKELTKGQKLLLERHVIAFATIGYTAVAFLAWHEAEEEIIKAAEAVVIRQYVLKPPRKQGFWKDSYQEKFSTKYLKFFGLLNTNPQMTPIEDDPRIEEIWKGVHAI